MTDQRFEEVTLFMPSGQIIAGKWFGNKSTRPILCLHGSEDNAGTFDRLLPILSTDFSYLAIDLPGHGRSSWIPHGQQYRVVDWLYVIDFMYQHYQWDKISFMAHSIGTKLTFLYASLYPHRVDMMISLDAVAGPVHDKNVFFNLFHKNYEKFLIDDKRNRENVEPPAYTLEEMTDKMVVGTRQSVTRETAYYLLERNIKPSKKYPGKFCFSRDKRLQAKFDYQIDYDTQLDLAQLLTMPYLLMRVSNSSYAKILRIEHENKIIEVLKHHPNFQFHIVESNSHHVHLTEPEKVASIIDKFFRQFIDLKSHL